MINSVKLDIETLTEFQNIHHKIMPKRTNWFQKKSIYSNLENNELLEPILKKTFSLLNEQQLEQNIHFDPTSTKIEFHQRNCSYCEKNKGKNKFTWHYDDYAATPYETYTVIFYIRKDITVRDGNLEYKLQGLKYEHEIKEGDCLIFRGDLYHCPQPSWGFGCRDVIVGFVKRNH